MTRLLLCLLAMACLTVGAEEKKADGWVNLLGGSELKKNWTTSGSWIMGKDGVVALKPREGEKGWQRFDAWLWLKKEYKDFEIDFEYRLQKGGNSGFYLRVADRKNPVAKGIGVQIYDSAPGKDRKLTDHDSGGIIPGIPPTKNAARPAGQWNRFVITCKNDKLTVVLNGETVNEVDLAKSKLKDRPATGILGFQDHGLPLELRNIRIREL